MNLTVSIVKLVGLAFLLSATTEGAASGSWRIEDHPNPESPGRRVSVFEGDRPVAGLVYGEGQSKVYLHVFGEEGELLTNPGLDREGEAIGLYPHHRGIFIGWNRIESDLGTDNLWGMGGGGQIALNRLEELSHDGDSATIVAVLDWLSSGRDASGSRLLLTETRRTILSRPGGGATRIDCEFTLRANRDLMLGGDLHHAGIHFRAADEVAERREETAYLWEPDLPGEGGKVVHDHHRWVQFVFPIGDRWYRVTQLNAPTNPTRELSWRDYGRFGYFFKRELKKDEEITIHFRFLVEPVSDRENALDRSRGQDRYDAFVGRFRAGDR